MTDTGTQRAPMRPQPTSQHEQAVYDAWLADYRQRLEQGLEHPR